MSEPVAHLDPDRKIAGILAPVGAIRGTHDIGIGDTESLVELARWAVAKGFRLVQILPVNEAGSDHSPYNIISSMAIDPSTLSLRADWLPDLRETALQSILKKHGIPSLKEGPVRHAKVAELKKEALAAAHKALRGQKGNRRRVREFEAFCAREDDWLRDYAVFRALCSWNGNSDVVANWPVEHRSPSAAEEWRTSLAEDKRSNFDGLVDFFSYVQWIAMCQWLQVRKAFDALGVALMGDIPVGVSIYSADVWASPELFDLTRSSGAPPEKVFQSDPFTMKWGQNWGFPLYNWEAMARDNFAWWRRRLQSTCSVFHLLRVDHALGFFRIYSFPWRPEENGRFLSLDETQARELTGGRLPGFIPCDDSTPENCDRNRRQGDMLFRIFLEETGPHRIIAEDLGEVAPYVRPALQELEIPGFKIPQWERTDDGALVPGADYQRLSLATFATHDHPPVRQFWEDLFQRTQNGDPDGSALREMRELMAFCGCADMPLPCPFTPEVHAAFIQGLFATNSWLAVHQITDVLGLSDRFNVPGAVGDENWTARINGTIASWDRLYRQEVRRLSKAIRNTKRSDSN